MARINARFWIAVATATAFIVQTFGCTHLPSGKKAFNTFDECFSANVALAAAGGIGIGALTALITQKATGNSGAATATGVAAGAASAAAIGIVAWRKCAAVYAKSEVVATQPLPADVAAATGPARPSGLWFDRFDTRVEGGDDTVPVPEYEYTYVANDAALKDIPVRLHHRIEIASFTQTEDKRMVVADASGKPLLDASGRPIPYEMAGKVPRERLAWEPILMNAGGSDFVEDNVIQQGTTKAKFLIQMPTHTQLGLPLPIPMRHTVTIEVAEQKTARTVDFGILPAAERPKLFTSAPPANQVASAQARNQVGAVAQRTNQAAAQAPVQVAARGLPKAQSNTVTAAAPVSLAMNSTVSTFQPTHAVKREIPVYSDSSAQRKVVGNLAARTPVQIEDRSQTRSGDRTIAWVKVATRSGFAGWIRAKELTEIR
jgi:hypothetical protein